MSSKLSLRERKAVFAELKAECLFIVIPFLLLIAVKLYIATWQDIIMSPEWSLAACLIFGQITSKVSKAVASAKAKTSEQYFGWYTAKRFLWVLISTSAYFGMLAKPVMSLGVAQVCIFFIASYFHFKDGFAARLIEHE